MKIFGTYYFGIEYKKLEWFRINLFPFAISISYKDMFGLVGELSIFNVKIFFGTKVDNKF